MNIINMKRVTITMPTSKRRCHTSALVKYHTRVWTNVSRTFSGRLNSHQKRFRNIILTSNSNMFLPATHKLQQVQLSPTVRLNSPAQYPISRSVRPFIWEPSHQKVLDWSPFQQSLRWIFRLWRTLTQLRANMNLMNSRENPPFQRKLKKSEIVAKRNKWKVHWSWPRSLKGFRSQF